MDTEQKIVEQFSRQRHFTVPEGYFDSLSQRVMECIPQDRMEVYSNGLNQGKAKKRTIRMQFMHRYQSAITAAACAIVIVGACFFLSGPDNQGVTSQQSGSQISSLTYQDDIIEKAADVMMIDEDDIYTYLTDNN
jgi:hypothetical protein